MNSFAMQVRFVEESKMKSEDFSEQVNVLNYKVLEISQDDLILKERIRDCNLYIQIRLY
jgi:hypothetical protein